jgi:hypothetical protein
LGPLSIEHVMSAMAMAMDERLNVAQQYCRALPQRILYLFVGPEGQFVYY